MSALSVLLRQRREYRTVQRINTDIVPEIKGTIVAENRRRAARTSA